MQNEKPEITIGERVVIGRWQDRRGKTWIELYEQPINGRATFGYTTSWNAKGFFGPISQRKAFEKIEDDRSLCSTLLSQVPVPMPSTDAARAA
jgi:hypothetical protein